MPVKKPKRGSARRAKPKAERQVRKTAEPETPTGPGWSETRTRQMRKESRNLRRRHTRERASDPEGDEDTKSTRSGKKGSDEN